MRRSRPGNQKKSDNTLTTEKWIACGFRLIQIIEIHIDQIDGELCLRMDCIHKEYVSVFDMMLEWYEAWKKD